VEDGSFATKGQTHQSLIMMRIQGKRSFLPVCCYTIIRGTVWPFVAAHCVGATPLCCDTAAAAGLSAAADDAVGI
jgi:hypothetical protein